MRRIVSLILLAAALCSAVHAQAFCALRDPNRQIYRLFPKATSYRSIVRTVGKDARREVGARLPFNLHFNELGRHTLYVPMRGDEPSAWSTFAARLAGGDSWRWPGDSISISK